MKIAVVGLWHLGEIYSACLAEIGHTVIGISEDTTVVEGLKRNIPPLREPQLAEILAKHQKTGRLSYTTDIAAAAQCDAVWITFDTPVDSRDRADTSVIFKSIATLASHLKKNVLLVVSSQIPVGTSAEIVRFLCKKRRGFSFRYAYVPENLRLGEAVESFLAPNRIVIGTARDNTARALKKIFEGISAEYLIMDIASAEMVKHALNSFLATSLSFTYDIADVCERVGARSVDVMRALRADPRIGHGAYLDASLGFSGGTLGRDLGVLINEAKKHKLALPVIRAVLEKNRRRKEIVYQALEKHLNGVRNKRIAVLGLTYKAGTSTLRRSLALEVARGFHERGASLALCDPFAAEDEARQILKGIPFSFTRDPVMAFCKSSAALLISPWPALSALNFKKVRQAMKSPRVFFDARNFFFQKDAEIRNSGIKYLSVGNAPSV